MKERTFTRLLAKLKLLGQNKIKVANCTVFCPDINFVLSKGQLRIMKVNGTDNAQNRLSNEELDRATIEIVNKDGRVVLKDLIDVWDLPEGKCVSIITSKDTEVDLSGVQFKTEPLFRRIDGSKINMGDIDLLGQMNRKTHTLLADVRDTSNLIVNYKKQSPTLTPRGIESFMKLDVFRTGDLGIKKMWSYTLFQLFNLSDVKKLDISSIEDIDSSVVRNLHLDMGIATPPDIIVTNNKLAKLTIELMYWRYSDRYAIGGISTLKRNLAGNLLFENMFIEDGDGCFTTKLSISDNFRDLKISGGKKKEIYDAVESGQLTYINTKVDYLRVELGKIVKQEVEEMYQHLRKTGSLLIGGNWDNENKRNKCNTRTMIVLEDTIKEQ